MTYLKIPAIYRFDRQHIILAFLIILVCSIIAITHWPALSAKALSFDDNEYLTENPLVQNPGWSSAKRFLTEILTPSTVGGYYQPLTMISLMTDYAIGGRVDNLMPFHRTSLILHVINTGLIIVFLYMLFGQSWAAALAGLIFGVHPMTVETIPWIGERKTLLAAFFTLWCLILYVRYARSGSRGFFIASVIAYVLAMMSKPISLPVPALLLLLDFWPLGRLKWKTVWEKLPYFILVHFSQLLRTFRKPELPVLYLRRNTVFTEYFLYCATTLFFISLK